MTEYTLFEKDNYTGKLRHIVEINYYYGELELKDGVMNEVFSFGGETIEEAEKDFYECVRKYEKYNRGE